MKVGICNKMAGGLAQKAAVLGAVVGNAIMMAPVTDVFAAGSLLNQSGSVGQYDSIDVTKNNMTAGGVLSRLVGIIAGVISVGGIVTMIGGFQQYMEAKEDDNTAGQSKAQRKLIFGVIEMAAYPLIRFLFGA